MCLLLVPPVVSILNPSLSTEPSVVNLMLARLEEVMVSSGMQDSVLNFPTRGSDWIKKNILDQKNIENLLLYTRALTED